MEYHTMVIPVVPGSATDRYLEECMFLQEGYPVSLIIFDCIVLQGVYTIVGRELHVEGNCKFFDYTLVRGGEI